jgi:hypothetical protein
LLLFSYCVHWGYLFCYHFTVWFTTLHSSEVDNPYGRLKANVLSVEDGW